ncbi:hypothetical protein AVEN_146128-1 [Araneus ventricosus]|uniref:Uncharacterized protein n=1 Tax=Araneus ventricosus TaxID=182803 RepID=A0A4Y2KMC8_ARAVE|nr:hypothetical protein AVEN_146128-1 [Araneus ventricosus]
MNILPDFPDKPNFPKSERRSVPISSYFRGSSVNATILNLQVRPFRLEKRNYIAKIRELVDHAAFLRGILATRNLDIDTVKKYIKDSTGKFMEALKEFRNTAG